MVAVKNSGHYGLSGYYAEQAVKKNLITMIYTNAPPAVAPHGALKSLFGTNPVCFGTPTGSKIPFILDTSISVINRGKIRVAARKNQKIPEGVALDKFGNPTTDAKKTGIGLVAVKNSGHYGLSGYYAEQAVKKNLITMIYTCLLYTSPSPRDGLLSRMPSSA